MLFSVYVGGGNEMVQKSLNPVLPLVCMHYKTGMNYYHYHLIDITIREKF